jgi:glycosyltransferase involved in cell wall biosynthesis
MPIYFSIVIPTYNRIDTLIRVLDALEQQSGAPPFEVIVIDDGSADATEETMIERVRNQSSFYRLRYERQKNSGPGKARNRGAALAFGRYVVFIGDDTVPEAMFLAEHARAHREHGDDQLIGVLGYTGWPAEERVTAFMDYINDYGLQFGYRLIESQSFVPFNFFYTSNLSVDRELLLRYPFDTSFPGAAWEDIELAYRLEAIGFRLFYNARAVTRHYHRMTIDSFARRQYGVGKSGAIFASKHPELRHFLGVEELKTRPIPSSAQLKWMTLMAKAGEKLRFLARPALFEKLMREHYLRGLREGVSATSSS